LSTSCYLFFLNCFRLLRHLHSFPTRRSSDLENTLVIIPEEALNDEDFIDGTKPYLSDNKQITRFDVILEDYPYSKEAIQMIDQIEQNTHNAKKETVLDRKSVV